MPSIRYSNRALQDLVLYRRVECHGYGLLSGVRLGHIFIIDHFHFLGLDYNLALNAYHAWPVCPISDCLGIFSVGIATLPVMNHEGLFLMLAHEAKMHAYLCRAANGNNKISHEELEATDERE